ncbi:hypothetical protein DM02DRAFT_709470, partial [Periconia macrospinosa]
IIYSPVLLRHAPFEFPSISCFAVAPFSWTLPRVSALRVNLRNDRPNQVNGHKTEIPTHFYRRIPLKCREQRSGLIVKSSILDSSPFWLKANQCSLFLQRSYLSHARYPDFYRTSCLPLPPHLPPTPQYIKHNNAPPPLACLSATISTRTSLNILNPSLFPIN